MNKSIPPTRQAPANSTRNPGGKHFTAPASIGG